MDTKITTTLPSAIIPRIEKIVAKLNKKLSSFGLATIVFLYTLRIDRAFMVEMADITISIPEIETGTGWRLVAIYKPGITESYSYLLQGAVEEDIPEAYRSVDSETAGHCEHCGWSRKRNTTVLLRNDAEDRWVRVGSSCVSDFLGLGADKVLAAIASLDKIRKELSDPKELPVTKAYSARDILAHTAKYLSEGFGYIPEGHPMQNAVTWVHVQARMDQEKPISVEKKFYDFADKAIAWLPTHLDKVDPERVISLHRNMETACHYDGDGAGMVTVQSGGFASVVALAPYVREHSTAPSKPAVKERLEAGRSYQLDVEITHLGITFQSSYHQEPYTVRRFVAKTPNGAVVTWIGKADLFEGTPGYSTKRHTIKAQCKGHNSFRGVEQALLTRVRLAK